MEQLKKIIRSRNKKTESPMEYKILNELYKYDDLQFETQYKIDQYRLDFAFPKYNIGLEIDGNDYHSSEKQQIRDQLRDEYLLKIKGWKIYRLEGWFCSRHPEIAVIKVLEHIPEVHKSKRYIHSRRQMLVYFVRELHNRGHRELSEKIMKDIT